MTLQSTAQITTAGRPRCRFDLFVRVADPRRHYNKETFCYRGDKFTDQPPLMLQKLVKMFAKNIHEYRVAELYDNTRPKDDEDRIVIKLVNGVIEKNRLLEYAPMLQHFAIPQIFQP